MTAFLLWFACSGEPSTPLPEATDVEAVVAEEPAPPSFNYRGEDVPLVPNMAQFHATLKEHKLSAAAARHAKEQEYKPDVMVAKIAAARTGAELGALFVEAGDGELPVMVARAERIRAGLESINDDGPALVKADALLELLRSDPPRDELLAAMDDRMGAALDELGEHAGDELIPLVMAGAWLQAYDLVALAMEETGEMAAGPTLLRQPLVGAWFTSYTGTVGQDFIPGGMLGPLTDSLKKLETATDHQPMTLQDAADIRDATESLLGMM